MVTMKVVVIKHPHTQVYHNQVLPTQHKLIQVVEVALVPLVVMVLHLQLVMVVLV